MTSTTTNGLLTDPVTLEPFVQPVLASDGHTYSIESLCKAMDADPWHRSPVTGEVLRPKVFSNVVVANMLKVPVAPALTATRLFSDSGELTFAQSSAGGRQWCFSLPRALHADAAAVRVRLRIPADATVVLRVRVLVDSRGNVTCMHAPCAVNIHDTAKNLLDMFGVRGFISKPNLANAILEIDGKQHFVEEWIWNALTNVETKI